MVLFICGVLVYFSRAGFVGVSVDGPHGGRRNLSQGDEQFLMFNFVNPQALRDNVRQTAVETALADTLQNIDTLVTIQSYL